MKKAVGLVFLAMISAVICPKLVGTAELIRVDGSSTVFPITEAVAEEFGKQAKAKVIVGISGTGGGFQRFCRRDTDINDASRPIKQKEIDACREGGVQYIELKIAFDGLAVVVNKENNWVDYLTVAELKKIWEPSGQNVMIKWNQVRSAFPDKELQLFGPGTDSGTFDYFTEVINGQASSSRGDYMASEDDNVLVEGVASNAGGLGYLGLAYYKENIEKLRVVPIKNGDGSPITPSKDTVLSGEYTPLSRPLFIYVNKDSLKNKSAVKGFVEYYLKNAATLAQEVGFIPLPSGEYEAGLMKL